MYGERALASGISGFNVVPCVLTKGVASRPCHQPPAPTSESSAAGDRSSPLSAHAVANVWTAAHSPVIGRSRMATGALTGITVYGSSPLAPTFRIVAGVLDAPGRS